MKLRVDNVKENGDGSVTVDFELDDEMEEFIAKRYGVTVEELTPEQTEEFVLEAINGLVKEKEKELQQP
jgi:hypothetical protein